ncbi:CesT family type III secretion system chaperone [Rhizobacter sp. SG703]|uniref:CesT family type III secretion system chaperone n=1 Tax=Rhizobacter sp. SG703 TaxID=2587140 RepID=UPI00144527B1|nr:CesT family type III secretion system chaperone [Rhizobacter sp. SG703]NKI95283.1 hypothetical protein [Rhizobacter sp. SG703]
MPPLSINLFLHGEALTLTRVCSMGAGDQLIIECRVGRIPPGREAFWHERLLVLNFQICTLQRSGYSLCPDTAEVTCSATCPLDGLSPETIYASAVRLATTVRQWRVSLSQADA